MAKQLTAFRIDPVFKAILKRMAEVQDCTVSDIVRELIPGEPWSTVLTQEFSRSEGTSLISVLYALAGEGLAKIMAEHVKPIDPYFLSFSGPDAAADYYLTFLDAVATDRGIKGLLGNKYRFAKPPKGGAWERSGVTGYGVLVKNNRFTKNGTEQVIDE